MSQRKDEIGGAPDPVIPTQSEVEFAGAGFWQRGLLMKNGLQLFTDDTPTTIRLLGSDPTQEQRDAAFRELQKFVAAICGAVIEVEIDNRIPPVEVVEGATGEVE